MMVTRASSSSPALKSNLKSPVKRRGNYGGPKSKEQMKYVGKKLRLDPDSEKALTPRNLKLEVFKLLTRKGFTYFRVSRAERDYRVDEVWGSLTQLKVKTKLKA
ncbi:hypothetical protein TorRG33x02_320620 [Trema orientale]|uniref:Uncharacterized protein n=1 Tax=Trema orientale TaxID=63057 RepID=A0A2P5BHN8_TREOI|nr:hypothetical protein TorRG33x02_320620 [Trema orientale]